MSNAQKLVFYGTEEQRQAFEALDESLYVHALNRLNRKYERKAISKPEYTKMAQRILNRVEKGS